MSMRISSAALALALAGCGGETGPPPSDDRSNIECALNGATEYARDCTIERAGETLIVRHPDGGFRRFIDAADGISSDGAEELRIEADGAVAIGGDRYRLP